MHLSKIAQMKSNLKKSEIVHISRPEVIFAKLFDVNVEFLMPIICVKIITNTLLIKEIFEIENWQFSNVCLKRPEVAVFTSSK